MFPQNSNHLVAKEAIYAALIIVHMCTPTPVSCRCVLVYLIEEADSIPSSPGGTTLSVFTSNSTSPIGTASVCVRAFRILKAPLVYLVHILVDERARCFQITAALQSAS